MRQVIAKDRACSNATVISRVRPIAAEPTVAGRSIRISGDAGKDSKRMPGRYTPVGGSIEWHQTLWVKMAEKVDPKMAALLNYIAARVSTDLSEEIRRKFPLPIPTEQVVMNALKAFAPKVSGTVGVGMVAAGSIGMAATAATPPGMIVVLTIGALFVAFSVLSGVVKYVEKRKKKKAYEEKESEARLKEVKVEEAVDKEEHLEDAESKKEK